MTTEPTKRRGLLIILSSPSGAGKSTLAHRLRDWDSDIVFSVSSTTRDARPGEVDGEHYHFVSVADFKGAVKRGEMLEHAHVFGNFYGSPKGPVQAAIDEGRDVLFDIDWQGTQQLKEKAREDLVSVFILPPSVEELERRLRARAQDSDEVVRGRMAKAADEMSHWPEYDYIVVNSDVDHSTEQVASILEAERLRRERQVGLTDFVNKLREG